MTHPLTQKFPGRRSQMAMILKRVTLPKTFLKQADATVVTEWTCIRSSSIGRISVIVDSGCGLFRQISGV